MSAAVFYRRRAERFAQLLDEADGLRHLHSVSPLDAELVPLVGVRQAMARLSTDFAPSPTFREDLRAQLVAAAERQGATRMDTRTEVTTRPATRRQARARGAIIVGLAAGTLALSGISAASSDAVPGDALYGIKRSTERAQLALASSDVSRGQLYLVFAKTRGAEATAVHTDQTSLAAVLDDMDDETRQGVRLLHTAAVDRRDPAALDVVNDFVAYQQKRLAGLLQEAGPASRSRLVESLTFRESVARRATSLRAGLNCGASGAGDDVLGPMPSFCHAEGGRTNPPTVEQPPPAGGGSDGHRTPRGNTPRVTPSPSSSSSQGPVDQPTEAPASEGAGGLLSDVRRLIGDLLGH